MPSPTSFLKVKTFLDKNTSFLFLFVLMIVITAESMGLASAAIPIFNANGSGQIMATVTAITIFGSLGIVKFLVAYKIASLITEALKDMKVTIPEVLMVLLFIGFYYILWKGMFHINLVLEGVIPLSEMVQKILPESLIGNYNLISTKSVTNQQTPSYNNFRAMALNVIVLYVEPVLEISVAGLTVMEGLAAGKASRTTSGSTASPSVPAPTPTPIPSPSTIPSPTPTPSPIPSTPSSPSTPSTPTPSGLPATSPSTPSPSTRPGTLSGNAGRFSQLGLGNLGNLLGTTPP